MREKNTAIICGTLIFLAIMGVYTFLEANHISTGGLLPLITGLMAAVAAAGAYQKTSKVEKQTNGPLTQGLSQIDDVSSRVNNLETTIGSTNDSVNQIQGDFNDIKTRIESFLEGQGH